MDSLIKASENFEQVNNIEETLDESLFLEYMRKVPIWDFFCVSKQEYLKMAEEEKKKKISQYYSAMQSRHVPDGEFLIFYFYFVFRMSLSIKNYKEVTRSFIHRLILSNSAVNSLGIQKIKSELTENKFFGENSHVLWWRIHYDSFNQIERVEPIFIE